MLHTIDDYINYVDRLLGGDCFPPISLGRPKVVGQLSVLRPDLEKEGGPSQCVVDKIPCILPDSLSYIAQDMLKLTARLLFSPGACWASFLTLGSVLTLCVSCAVSPIKNSAAAKLCSGERFLPVGVG